MPPAAAERASVVPPWPPSSTGGPHAGAAADPTGSLRALAGPLVRMLVGEVWFEVLNGTPQIDTGEVPV